MTDGGPLSNWRSQEWEGLASVSLKRNMPLVPAASIAGRALVTVIAIMTFLAALAAGSGVLVGEASRGWLDSVSREMTVQIKPVAGRDIEADVRRAEEAARAAPGVVKTRIFNKAQSAHLLEPWLGAGLDLGELPIPRLIVLELGPGRFDPAALRRALAERLPNAMLDDHRLWMERLAAVECPAITARRSGRAAAGDAVLHDGRQGLDAYQPGRRFPRSEPVLRGAVRHRPGQVVPGLR
jgi:cell division transport system permease protein